MTTINLPQHQVNSNITEVKAKKTFLTHYLKNWVCSCLTKAFLNSWREGIGNLRILEIIKLFLPMKMLHLVIEWKRKDNHTQVKTLLRIPCKPTITSSRIKASLKGSCSYFVRIWYICKCTSVSDILVDIYHFPVALNKVSWRTCINIWWSFSK